MRPVRGACGKRPAVLCYTHMSRMSATSPITQGNPMEHTGQVTTSPYFKWSRGFILVDGSLVLAQEDDSSVTVFSGIKGVRRLLLEDPTLTLDLYRDVNVGPLADLLDKALRPFEYGFELDYGNQELRVYDNGTDFEIPFYATWLASNVRSPEFCLTPAHALAKAILAVPNLTQDDEPYQPEAYVP